MTRRRFPAVILAGGASRRMGVPDKCLLPLDGKPLLGHVLETLAPQVTDILLNTNSAPENFTIFGHEIRADVLPDRLGPLAGVLTGLLWAREIHPHARYLVSAPADAPLLPKDMV